jgi:hypothetical protein
VPLAHGSRVSRILFPTRLALSARSRRLAR